MFDAAISAAHAMASDESPTTRTRFFRNAASVQQDRPHMWIWEPQKTCWACGVGRQ